MRPVDSAIQLSLTPSGPLLPSDMRPRNEQTLRTAPPAKAEPIFTHKRLSPTAIASLASQVPGTTGTYLFPPEDPTDAHGRSA